jgi:hypothetical protein
MGASNIARTALVSAVIASSAVGCAGRSEPFDDFSAPTRLQIDSPSGHFAGPFPAQLDATFSSTPTFRLTFVAGDGQRTWGASLNLSREQALAGHASIPISAGVLAEGEGSVQLIEGAFDVVAAISGKVDFAVSGGRAWGSAEVVPAGLSGSFDGAFSVSCTVPVSRLPPSATAMGGVNPSDGVEVLMADQGFTTPECQPFRALVPGT